MYHNTISDLIKHHERYRLVSVDFLKQQAFESEAFFGERVMLDKLLSHIKLMEWNVASSFRTEKISVYKPSQNDFGPFHLSLICIKNTIYKFDLIISVY